MAPRINHPTYRFEAAATIFYRKDLEDDPSAYLCGNSLGALPKRSQDLVQEEMKVWAQRYAYVHHVLDPKVTFCYCQGRDRAL